MKPQYVSSSQLINENKDLVTIVVPAYNAEQFLIENLESIINQSYRNLEIIYVCDGCTDHTAEILQKYAENDFRIIVQIEKVNQGAAIARNIGMNMAKGNWIIFLDADDLFESHMIEVMLETAISSDADMCCCYLSYFDDVPDKNVKVDNDTRKKYCNTYPVIKTREELGHIIQVVYTTPCTKLIHKSIYKKDEVFFQDIPNANDLYYSITATLNSTKIAYVDQVLLHYRGNKSRHTISTDRDFKKSYVMEAYDKIYEYIQKKGKNADILKSFYNEVLFALRCYSNYVIYDDLIGSFRNKYLEKWNMNEQNITENLSSINRIFYKNVLDSKRKMDTQSMIMQAKVEFVRILSSKGCSVWGVGAFGEKLLKETSNIDIKIQHVFDSAQDMWGKRVHGYLIENFDEVCADNIIITSPQYYNEIKEQIGNRAKRVYNLEQQIYLIPDEEEA